MFIRKSINLIVLSLSFLLMSASASAQEGKPDATVEILKESIGFLVSGTRGQGTLFFNGQEYPFTLRAIGAGGAGASRSDVVGDVFNLNDVADFPGRFTSVRAGGTVGETGLSHVHMQNDKGVEIFLRTKESEGIRMNLGVDVFSIEMGN